MHTHIDEASLEFIEIGNEVQITRGCTILAHDYSYSVCHCIGELPRVQGVTRIGSNVFLGMNTVVLMGAQIGDNVIVGAGSVVTGTLKSNAVYAENPAKYICSLEVFCKKNTMRMVKSARIYAKQKEKHLHRVPKVHEMGFYTSLFLIKNEENMQKYFSNSYHKDCIKKIKKQFDSVKELIEGDQ